MLKRFLSSGLNVYRLYGVLGGVLMVPFRYIFPEDAIDPLWWRVIVSAIMICYTISTFVSPYIRKYYTESFTVVILSVLIWIELLVFANDLSIYYFISFMVVNFSLVLIVSDRRSFFMVVFAVLGGVIWGASTVENPEMDPLFVMVMTGVSVFLAASAIQSRLFSVFIEFKKKEESNFINYSAIGASQEGILLVGPEGDFIRANATYLKFMDLPEEYVRENRQEETLNHVLERVAEPGKLVELINRPQKEGDRESAEEIELKNGLVLEISYISVFQDGKSLGRMWFFRDITRRKEYEQNLIESERRMREQNDHLMKLAAHTSLKSGDMDSAFEVITQSTANLLEVDTISVWTFEQGVMLCQKLYVPSLKVFEKGHKIPFSMYPDYFQKIRETRLLTIHDTTDHPIAHGFKQGRHTGVAGALCHAQIRSGEELIGLLSVECTQSRNWTIEDQAFVSSMADLLTVAIEQDRRRRITEELERSNNILTATFQLSETGILVVDENQRPLHYNDLYLRMWNISDDFILNASYEEIVKVLLEQVKEAPKLGQRSALLKERPEMETAGIIEFKDGRVVERYSKAIDLTEGQVGRVWFYLDVTDRTRKEQELIERNFELDSFVYRASHDLKAPLNSIMGLIGLIREEEELNLILNYVGLMDKSVKKLEEFIRQLTQFSQDARLKVVRKPIDLEEMVREVWQDLGFMDNAGRVQFSVVNQQDAKFWGDPVRLGIVLNNLISNAVKYQDLQKDQTEIAVSIAADAEQATISVQDNGLGIPEDYLPKIFDLFFRASVQATGSGLGLYITRSATEKMGGKLTAESTAGQGSVFHLHLPNHPVEEEETSEGVGERQK